MTSVKELKSIDLSSFTTVMTGIAVIFSILFSIVITLAIGLISVNSLVLAIFIVPTLIFGTLIFTTYDTFIGGFLYNAFAKRFNPITITFKDEKEIVKISPVKTAVITAIISAIQTLIFLLASIIIVPTAIGAIGTSLYYSGSLFGYVLISIANIIGDPRGIAIITLAIFILAFVATLIACYIYNILGTSGRGAIVNLSAEDGLTAIESFDIIKLGIVFAIVGGILNLILVLMTLMGGVNIITIITNILIGFIASFINGVLIAIFYNFLASNLGKIKLELIDQ